MDKVIGGCCVPAIALAVLWASVALAADLQPRTYVSPDGTYALTVNPGERSGAGPGTYTLKHGSQQQWSIALPFTLQDAVVDDQGHFGGYAYTNGRGNDDGEFVAAIVGTDGRILAQQREPRSPSHYLHVRGNPHVEGLIRDDDAHRLVIRIADPDVNANVETW